MLDAGEELVGDWALLRLRPDLALSAASSDAPAEEQRFSDRCPAPAIVPLYTTLM